MDLEKHKEVQEQMRQAREDLEYLKSVKADRETIKLMEDTLVVYEEIRRQQTFQELKEQLHKVRDMASDLDINVEVLDEAIELWDETINTLNKNKEE